MKIRKLRKKDVDEVCALISKCVNLSKNLTKKEKAGLKKRTTPQALIKKMEKRFQYFVCEDKGKILGIGGLNNNKIRTMYVSIKYQGKGIGSEILKRIEKHGKSRGKKKLFLYTHKKASKFYLKNNYKIKPSKTKGIYMQKKL
jgi:N-acetylglutamate synthase-like GNAT family acetyltransferase